jgi:hypothetical protein
MQAALTDRQLLEEARRLRLRDPDRAIENPVVRRAIEASWNARARIHERRLRAIASSNAKIASSGDAP